MTFLISQGKVATVCR